MGVFIKRRGGAESISAPNPIHLKKKGGGGGKRLFFCQGMEAREA